MVIDQFNWTRGRGLWTPNTSDFGHIPNGHRMLQLLPLGRTRSHSEQEQGALAALESLRVDRPLFRRHDGLHPLSVSHRRALQEYL